MPEDPLIRSVDPQSMRLQMQRRSPASVAAHPLWEEASRRLSDRLSYIKAPGPDLLHHGVSAFGQPMHHQANSLDMLVSVGLLTYLADPRKTLGFWAQLLKPGGLLMFCCLGPDSLRPLALGLSDDRNQRHVPGYPDMHDLGDALMGLGMANPVMDVERISLTYSSAQAALDDLRALGGNALRGRPGHLRGRAWRTRVLEVLEGMRGVDRIQIPFELVFGHAWKMTAQRESRQEVPIQWLPRKPKNSS